MATTPLVFMVTLFGFGNCDFTFIGNCPAANPMVDFDVFEFLGLWYTIEKSTSTVPCLQYGILENRERRGQFQYFEIDLDEKSRHKYRTSELLVTGLNSGTMLLRQPREQQASHFVVLETDYKTYAITLTYKQVASACKLSAKILSRNPELDENTMEQIRHLLSSYNLTTSVRCYEPPETSTVEPPTTWKYPFIRF
ncbi:hypothetical protein PPYR_03413 [Photinus pyralis]|uniref:Lipocalin/cytosolic fatty-acid binding domain-containing protein n=1 Tax=Photinus pyralis TaxID=7054 RepID=A0A1Y1MBR0_PHOPY|nr:apolipoprotein D-like [Photinus pyralis]KAB0791613.1 hypothetical protein PPYR_03413 [Photinus pyralis]